MANRKLQTEIDRTLKKIQEGVDLFDEIWDKVYSATNANQKEKYEADLKKEIKKLQRYRDQIKTWQTSSDIKDKRPLTDARKLIETQMERFKVCEKEFKTKAYSNEGLGQKPKEDPREVERSKVRKWISAQLSAIADQIDAFEADKESLMANTKGKKGKANAKGVEEIDDHINRHRFHEGKLEQILRLVENDDLTPEQINESGIKDSVEYFIESNAEPDFYDDETIYDDLNLDDFQSAAKDKDDEDDEEGADSGPEEKPEVAKPAPEPAKKTTSKKAEPVLVQPAKMPAVKTPTPVVAAAQTKAATKLPAKPVAESPARKVPTPGLPPPQPAAVVQPGLPPAASAQRQILPSGLPGPGLPGPGRGPPPQPAAAAAPVGLPPKGTVTIQSHGPGLPPPGSQHTAESLPPAATPQAHHHHGLPPPSQAQPSGQASSGGQLDNSKPGSTHPQAQGLQAAPGPTPPQSGIGGSLGGALGGSASVGGSGLPSEAPAKSLSKSLPLPTDALSSVLQRAPEATGGGVPSSPSVSGAAASTALEEPSGEATPLEALDKAGFAGGSDDSGFSQHMQQVPVSMLKDSILKEDGSETADGKDGASAGMAGLNLGGLGLDGAGGDEGRVGEVFEGMSVAEDHLHAVQMLHCSLRNIPEPADSERPKQYVPRNPYPTPSSFPQTPAPVFDNPAIFEKFDTDTLFFIFYYQQGTYQQYLAARELKKQSWRYHKKYLTWFQRHEEPKVTTDEYEQGTYVYFDYETGWCQRIKTEFTFEYGYLEDELVV